MTHPTTSPDTIAAIATAPGRGGVGVVRVSGPGAAGVAQGLLGRLPKPRYATLAELKDAQGRPIDQGLALYFPAPHSYTGESVLELHGHGGPAVLQALLDRCLELGARPAEPGEFTRRAYLNGKLDLAQAEAVADLIDAASAEAARAAARSLMGAFSQHVHALQASLTELRMRVEATIDFPEEEDVVAVETARVQAGLEQTLADLERVLASAEQGALLREGVHVALIGQPNVGKSSLLNALAGEEVAIVTEIAGTTRDAIRQAVDITGVPFWLVDTAGLRETDDPVEKPGIARTWAAVEKAGIALLLVDAAHGIGPAELAIIARLPPGIARLTVHNKIDLGREAPRVEDDGAVWVSAKTGAGMDLLRQALLRLAGWQPAGEGAYLARRRHLRALADTRRHLRAALELAGQLELQAEELRLAQEALGAITGEHTPDDLLGEIFSRFCVGK